ncbi:sortase B protein-sorting domain-containing protein [Haoranjiania flava]
MRGWYATLFMVISCVYLLVRRFAAVFNGHME